MCRPNPFLRIFEDLIVNANTRDFDALFDLLCEVCADYAQSH